MLKFSRTHAKAPSNWLAAEYAHLNRIPSKLNNWWEIFGMHRKLIKSRCITEMEKLIFPSLHLLFVACLSLLCVACPFAFLSSHAHASDRSSTRYLHQFWLRPVLPCSGTAKWVQCAVCAGVSVSGHRYDHERKRQTAHSDIRNINARSWMAKPEPNMCDGRELQVQHICFVGVVCLGQWKMCAGMEIGWLEWGLYTWKSTDSFAINTHSHSARMLNSAFNSNGLSHKVAFSVATSHPPHYFIPSFVALGKKQHFSSCSRPFLFHCHFS